MAIGSGAGIKAALGLRGGASASPAPIALGDQGPMAAGPLAAPPLAPVIDTYDGTAFSAAGAAEAGSTVTLRSGSTVLGTAVANGSGRWLIDFAALASGTHNLTATAANGDGAGPASAVVAVQISFGDQRITGGTASERLTGSAENDTLDGRGGDDTMIGGESSDTYYVDSAGDVVVDSGGFEDAVITTLANYTLGAGIEHIRGDSALGHVLTGNGLDNFITGDDGADSLVGGQGDDSLNGAHGTGSDTLVGGDGDDWMQDPGSGLDQMLGGQGNDIYQVIAGDTVVELADQGRDRVETALASYTLGDNVEDLYGERYAAQVLTGNGLNNRINASYGDDGDTLDGAGGDDYLVGQEGNDVLVGGAGNDHLHGLSEDDTLTGGAGNDTLNGGQNGDEENVDADDDLVVFNGARANYVITRTDDGYLISDQRAGSPDGSDVVIHVERVRFSDGDFTTLDLFADGLPPSVPTIRGFWAELVPYPTEPGRIHGHSEPGTKVTIHDGATVLGQVLASINGNWEFTLPSLADGAHAIRVSATDASADPDSALSAPVNAMLAGGRWTIGGGDLGESIIGARDADSISGGGGDDRLEGEAGADTLVGGVGDDTMDGANGFDGGVQADTMIGGVGDDVYIVDHAGDVIIEAKKQGVDTVRMKLATYTLAENFENIQGQSLSQNLTGNAADNYIRGGSGNDSLTGGAGDDTLGGEDGIDTLNGGAGNDTYEASSSDTIVEAENGGIDEVATILTTYTLGANLENLRSTSTYGSLGKTFTGNGADNVITSDAGNDRHDGAGGDDLISGGGYNDTLTGGEGDDTLEGGDHVDTASYATADGAVTVALGSGVATGAVGTDKLRRIESLIGSGFNDTLTGSAGANTIQAGAGDDRVDGGAGNDRLDGGAGVDTLAYAAARKGVKVDLSLTTAAQDTKGAGLDWLTTFEVVIGTDKKDTLAGDSAANTLSGGGAGDILAGGGGNDSLEGGAGADKLFGGAGPDRLTGGAAGDAFIFTAVGDSLVGQPDLITDLAAIDRIDLRAIDANDDKAGDQAFELAAAFTGKAGQAVLSYDSGANLTSLALDTDGDSTADMQVQMTGNHTGFGNFVL